MLKGLFRSRLFIGALAFFVLCVGGSLLYVQHVEQQTADKMKTTKERIKTLSEKQNPQPTTEAPVAEASPGHFHADGTWHGEPHKTEVQPTAEVSQLPPKGSPLVIAQGNPTSVTQTHDAEKIARYQQRVTQYRKDYNVWSEKRNKANTEWVQAGETLDNIGGRGAEFVMYVRSLSEMEKRELAAKLQDALEKYLAASEKLTLIMKEEPVPPTQE